MFVACEIKMNKSKFMANVAELVKESKEQGVSRWYEWTNKKGEKKAEFLRKMSRRDIMEMKWYMYRKMVANHYAQIEADAEMAGAALKNEKNKTIAASVIGKIKTIDDFKAVLPQLKISQKTWWKMATEANVDDKVKRYGYGRLSA